jgi:L-lactate dehydrogenase complex protein LldF
MVSEEIDLNAALARAGVDVLETDLGEFIVQVDKDHPSHIVAPIIHKSRHDIAKSFRGLGATDEDVVDVPQMTAFARRLLRAGFLKADMGISGGNFGVAETGSLCVCTNEGNGRLTTTLPRVHVALMGIERVVPTLADLEVMLQLLGTQRHRSEADGVYQHHQRAETGAGCDRCARCDGCAGCDWCDGRI